MSEGLAQQMANEWEHQVREYAKKNPKKNPFTIYLALLIEHDILRSHAMQNESPLWDSLDISRRAVEILKERMERKPA